MSIFRSKRFRRIRSILFDKPRRPRHRALRFVLGLLGVALLLALVFVGVFAGTAMLAGGMLWRLWTQRTKPVASPRNSSIDGDYRVIDKAQLAR